MKSMTALALDWAIRAFGREHVYNGPIRTLRLVEEAVEVAQTYGVRRDKIIDLVNVVYARPVGKVYQKIGGVMLTTHILCGSLDLDPDELLSDELRRVLANSPEHFGRRNDDKNMLGMESRPNSFTVGTSPSIDCTRGST